ncbi:MAG: hypothetical protein HOY75_27405 [Streptomyces sp.]|nr:hypothetical protein [Streptomyces sp.]
MSARTPGPCDIPAEHEGPVRFYLTGWKCDRHAPTPETYRATTAAVNHRKDST